MRQDRLLSYPELLTERLGLRDVGGAGNWTLRQSILEVRAPSSAYSILPIPISSLMRSRAFLRDRDWMYAAELFHVIDRLWRTERSVPTKIRNALIDRILSRQTSSTVDLELFTFLGRWDSESLAGFGWSSALDRMAPRRSGRTGGRTWRDRCTRADHARSSGRTASSTDQRWSLCGKALGVSVAVQNFACLLTGFVRTQPLFGSTN